MNLSDGLKIKTFAAYEELHEAGIIGRVSSSTLLPKTMSSDPAEEDSGQHPSEGVAAALQQASHKRHSLIPSSLQFPHSSTSRKFDLQLRFGWADRQPLLAERNVSRGKDNQVILTWHAVVAMKVVAHVQDNVK